MPGRLDNYPDIKEDLRRSASRWTSLSVSLLVIPILKDFKFDTLEELRISSYAAYHGTGEALQNVPRLRKFVNENVGASVKLDPSVWSGIHTVVDAAHDGPTINNFVSMEQVVDMELQLPYLPDAALSIRALPHLKRLHLRATVGTIDESGIATFFSKFQRLPSLASLGLTYSWRARTVFPDISACASHLTELKVDCDVSCHPENATALLSFLSTASAVTSLTIISTASWPSELLNGLEATEAVTVLPRLRHLDITHPQLDCANGWNTSAPEVTEDQVLAVMGSRIGRTGPNAVALENLAVPQGWRDITFKTEGGRAAWDELERALLCFTEREKEEWGRCMSF